MTRAEALALGYGDMLYHGVKRQGRGGAEPLRVRVTGKVRTWKRDPERLEIPTKHGLRQNHTITEHELALWYTSPEEALQHQEMLKRRETVGRVVSPHGMCARAGKCVEHEIDPSIESCDGTHIVQFPEPPSDPRRVGELLELLTFMLAWESTSSTEGVQRVLAELSLLGADKEADRVLDRYDRKLPPFRGSKGRFKR